LNAVRCLGVGIVSQIKVIKPLYMHGAQMKKVERSTCPLCGKPIRLSDVCERLGDGTIVHRECFLKLSKAEQRRLKRRGLNPDKVYYARIRLDREDAELLKRDFGSVAKGIRELIARYRHSLGPKSPRLRLAYHALLQKAEASGKISWPEAIRVVCEAIGCTQQTAIKYIQELQAQGYVDSHGPELYVRTKRADLGNLPFL